jgi:hypothetical protein
VRVEVISGADAGQVLDLDDGSAVIGRAPGLDLTLTDGRVSTRHLRLQISPSGATVTDLGSTNGTTLGSRRLPPDQPTPLDEGARIGLGDTVLQITGLRAGPTGTVVEGAVPPAAAAPSGPPPTAIGQPPPEMPRIVPPSPPPVAAPAAAAPPPYQPPYQPPGAPPSPGGRGGGGGGQNRNLLIGAGIGAAILIVGIVAALALGGGGGGSDATTTAVLPTTTALPPTTTEVPTTATTPTDSLTTPTDTVPTDTVPTDSTDTVPTDTAPTDTGTTSGGDANDPGAKLTLDQTFDSDSGPAVKYPSGWTVAHVAETDQAYETLDLGSAAAATDSNMHMRVIVGAPHNFGDFDSVSSLFARAKKSAEEHGYLDWQVTNQSTPKDGQLGNAPAQAAGFQWTAGDTKGRGVIFAARDPDTQEWVFGWAAFVDSNADETHVQARDDTVVDLVSSLNFS